MQAMIPSPNGGASGKVVKFAIGDIPSGKRLLVRNYDLSPLNASADVVNLTVWFSAKNGLWREFIWVRRSNGHISRMIKVYRVEEYQFGKQQSATNPMRTLIFTSADPEFPYDAKLDEDWNLSQFDTSPLTQ